MVAAAAARQRAAGPVRPVFAIVLRGMFTVEYNIVCLLLVVWKKERHCWVGCVAVNCCCLNVGVVLMMGWWVGWLVKLVG